MIKRPVYDNKKEDITTQHRFFGYLLFSARVPPRFECDVLNFLDSVQVQASKFAHTLYIESPSIIHLSRVLFH